MQRREAAMTDQLHWEQGTALMAALASGAAPQARRLLQEMAERYTSLKAGMLAVTLTVGSASVCRICSGQCCHNGKYRMSGFDLLALLVLGRPRPAPEFDKKPDCPYSTSGGCSMEPALRPLDCVVFICSTLDMLLEEPARTSLRTAERELRDIVARSEDMLPMRLGKPLLLLAEQHQPSAG